MLGYELHHEARAPFCTRVQNQGTFGEILSLRIGFDSANRGQPLASSLCQFGGTLPAP